VKTRAFQIRVLICFLLSLIPASDIENLIYSARLDFRGRWGAVHNLVIVETDTMDLANPPELAWLQRRIQAAEPALVLVDAPGHGDRPMVDSDGVVRRASFLPPTRKRASLTYRAWKESGSPALPKLVTREPHLINYVGPRGTIPSCRTSSLESCPALAGKIVIVGEEAEAAGLLRTPLGEMSRAEVLAHDVNTVVNRQFLREAPLLIRCLIILGLVLLGAFYIIYYPVILSALAVAGTGMVVVVVLFQMVLQLFDYYIPSFNIGLSLLITYLVFTGYRLAYQENLQWRSLKRAQYLHEVDQLKTNFLSLLSHDLKTPLAKIQAGVDRLKRVGPERGTELGEVVESLENSNQELKRYIESVLSLSRIESQKVILNRKSNDINRVIERALRRLQPLAKPKGIALETDLEPLFSVECDEDLMGQVVSNLIDNAIKHSPAGSRVIVRSREEDGQIRVDVEDFGSGIPKDKLPLVFRKFSRFLRPIHEPVRGTGLGLYLSKYFIELHGGSIRLKTEEGRGTTFTFTLPITPSPGLAVAPGLAAAHDRVATPQLDSTQPVR
jgi:two-component system, OmpR family, phosphate regulon sensor histidine kinase PhoR